MARGTAEGTVREKRAKPLPQPRPGVCEPAHRGHADLDGGERRRWFCNKIACSTAASHLSKATAGGWGDPDHNGVPS